MSIVGCVARFLCVNIMRSDNMVCTLQLCGMYIRQTLYSPHQLPALPAHMHTHHSDAPDNRHLCDKQRNNAFLGMDLLKSAPRSMQSVKENWVYNTARHSFWTMDYRRGIITIGADSGRCCKFTTTVRKETLRENIPHKVQFSAKIYTD